MEMNIGGTDFFRGKSTSRKIHFAEDPLRGNPLRGRSTSRKIYFAEIFDLSVEHVQGVKRFGFFSLRWKYISNMIIMKLRTPHCGAHRQKLRNPNKTYWVGSSGSTTSRFGRRSGKNRWFVILDRFQPQKWPTNAKWIMEKIRFAENPFRGKSTSRKFSSAKWIFREMDFLRNGFFPK